MLTAARPRERQRKVPHADTNHDRAWTVRQWRREGCRLRRWRSMVHRLDGRLSDGLRKAGVDLESADATIGTSAGAIVGAAIKDGRLSHLAGNLQQLGADPAMADKMLHISSGAASQARARTVMGHTDQVSPITLQDIGRAAMAAHNAPAADYADSLATLLRLADWPAGHHTTATDCYTGESLIVDGTSGVSIAQAAAASSSLPGVNGPTWIDDHLCMDGGVSTSSTHATTLQGAKAVLIIAMLDFAAHPSRHVNPSFGFAERIDPGTAGRETAALRATGSAVHVTIANPDPTIDFMSAATIGPALSEGTTRGEADAATIAEIWGVS